MLNVALQNCSREELTVYRSAPITHSALIYSFCTNFSFSLPYYLNTFIEKALACMKGFGWNQNQRDIIACSHEICVIEIVPHQHDLFLLHKFCGNMQRYLFGSDSAGILKFFFNIVILHRFECFYFALNNACGNACGMAEA